MRKCTNLERGEKKLVEALHVAKRLGHKVWIKNYDEGFEREEGMPEYVSFDYDTLLNGDSIETYQMPEFEDDGCNDVVIEVTEGAHKWEYNVWYSDNEEDRVYTDEIDNYLSEYAEKKEVA